MEGINEILSGIRGKNSCSTGINKPTIVSITESKGKVVIMFSNGSFIDADISLVDDCLCEALTKQQSNSIKDLSDFKEKLLNNLEPVMGSGGKTSHYVLNTNFKEVVNNAVVSASTPPVQPVSESTSEE